MNERYLYAEFEKHFRDYAMVRQNEHVTLPNGEQEEIGDSKEFVPNVLRVRDYMNQMYPNDEGQARDNFHTFVLIQEYLAEHSRVFNAGTLAVAGEDGGLVSRPLLRAVHHFYTTIPLSELSKRGPSPDEVMALAKKYQQEDENNSGP